MRGNRNRTKTGGQALVESALVLLAALAGLAGTADIAQMMFVHQSLTERVRYALRWGTVRAYDGTGDQLANMVMFKQSTSLGPKGYMNMTRANVSVVYTPGTVANPNDEQVTISVINLKLNFFSPYLAGAITNNYMVTQTATMMYKP